MVFVPKVKDMEQYRYLQVEKPACAGFSWKNMFPLNGKICFPEMEKYDSLGGVSVS
jgi:hypothetical protein